MINLSFEPSLYLKNLLLQLSQKQFGTGLPQKSVEYICNGIYAEFLSLYSAVQTVGEVSSLDEEVEKRVKELLPYGTKGVSSAVVPWPWNTSGPGNSVLLRQPLSPKPTDDPLRVTY